VTSSKNYVEVPIFESPASTNFTTRAGILVQPQIMAQ